MNQRDTSTWDEAKPPLLRSEIEMALKRLRNYKVTGLDDIVAEMIKATAEKKIDIIHKICSKIWITGEWPKECFESIHIKIHKKGAKENCDNYLTITLIPHTSKIMLYVIQERLEPYLLPQISQE